MTKNISITLTENQYNYLFEIIGDKSYYFSDNGLLETEEYKDWNKVYNKLIKSFNKSTGKYYLWQLIDREGEVNQQNIKKEWK